MNPALKEVPIFSFEDYLEWDLHQEEKHEYVNGRVFAMAGVTDDHDLVAVNMLAALHTHLHGKGCRVYTGDMKLKVCFKHAEIGYFPDVMVVCDPEDTGKLFKTRPKVLVEVMSDYRKDHVEKFMAYQHLESLEDYLVINQDPEDPKAWIYRRATNWDQAIVEREGTIELPSIGFSVRLEELYRA